MDKIPIESEATKILNSRPGFFKETLHIRNGPKRSSATVQNSNEVEKCLKNFKQSLIFPKVRKQNNLGQAEWHKERELAFISKTSKFFISMGHRTADGHNCLFSEEALYLLDVGDIELIYKNIPLSIQDAFELLLTETVSNNSLKCTLQEYQTFSHLVKLGFVVRRFAFDYCYEKNEMGPSKNDFVNACKERKPKQVNASNSTNTKIVIKMSKCRGWWMPPTEDLENSENIQIQDSTLHIFNAASPLLSLTSYELEKSTTAKQDEDNIPLTYSHTRKPNIAECKLNTTDWTIYKQKLKNANNSANNAFVQLLHEMWSKEVKPIVHPLKAFSWSALSNNLKITKECSELPLCNNDCNLSIKFNIYRPHAPGFKKTMPGVPCARVAVTGTSADFPSLQAQLRLQSISGNIPLLYAVVDTDQVAFYDFDQLGIVDIDF